MTSLKEVLEYLKSRTQTGRDAQELEEMQNLRQADIEARENYSQSPARIDFEEREKQRALAQLAESMYHSPMRKAESEERTQNAEADISFPPEEEVRREARYRKLMNVMNKNR